MLDTDLFVYNAVADLTHQLLTNEELHSTISHNALSQVNENFLTVANARNWLWIGLQMQRGTISGNMRRTSFPTERCRCLTLVTISDVRDVVHHWFERHAAELSDGLRIPYTSPPTPVATPTASIAALPSPKDDEPTPCGVPDNNVKA